MTLIEGPDCRLWVEIAGAGDPVSVFAHGLTSSTAELAPLAARAAGTRVLFDFRGHGRSDAPPDAAGYDLDAMCRDLATVADRFGATRALGVSMGAGALLRIVAGWPDRFERLAFFIPSRLDGWAPSDSEGFLGLARLLESESLERAAEVTLGSETYAPLFAVRPQWRDLVRARILRMNATGVPRALRAYAGGEAPLRDAGVLRAVRAPALVLGHEGDPIHDAAVARSLARALPRARLEIWSEPLAMYDDVDAFAAMIGGFLA